MTSQHGVLLEQGRQAKLASRVLARSSDDLRVSVLRDIAKAIKAQMHALLATNQAEVTEQTALGLSLPLQDRLRLTEQRVLDMVQGVEAIAAMPDPLGQTVTNWQCANGLDVRQVRVPLGVIGMIYEARPNVTVDAAALCLKAGNAVLLRGSRQAAKTNAWLVSVMQKVLIAHNLPLATIQLIADPTRASVAQLVTMRKYVDVIIPRGSAALIQTVVEQATVPVIETGAGNCHLYVDQTAPLKMALDIAINAKCSRPAVCNAIETILIHRDWAKRHFAALANRLAAANVEFCLCEGLQPLYPSARLATADDYAREFLDLQVAIKQVDSLDAAIDHINQYGTRHSEAIVTNDEAAAQRFQQEVDAACVYHNASTRFTDGSALGLGAEIGISTQKLHARGPMGLSALTSCKYVLSGQGQVRV